MPNMSATHLQLYLDLNRAQAVANRRFDGGLGSIHGIGLSDLQLLAALDRAPERRLRRVDLAQQLGLTPSGVTWLLRPLIKRRMVRSEPSAEDARVAYAVLTDAGHEMVRDALSTARQVAAEILGPRLNETEVARAAELLARIADPEAR
jgi:DNA-binding MarR family transcriptional regulator